MWRKGTPARKLSTVDQLVGSTGRGRPQTGRVPLTVTLHTSASPAGIDVVVDAAPGAVLGEIADGLRSIAGLPDGRIYAGSSVLDDALPVGEGPLHDGAVLGVGCPTPRAGDEVGVLELHVVGGPDAGQVVPLPRGRHVIGRGAGPAVSLDDVDVSREHAAITVGSRELTVEDLGSTNGTAVDGRLLGRVDPSPVRPGQLLQLGDSTLSLAVPHDAPVTSRPAGDGTIGVLRPPRLQTQPPAVEIDWPAPPVDPPRSPLAWVAIGLPAGLGVTMAVLLGSPAYLAMALLSPLVLLGSWLAERRGLRTGRRRRHASHTADVAEAQRRLDTAVAADAQASRAAHPDLAALLRTATSTGRRLWERRAGDPDALDLRLGTAELPTRVVVRAGAESSAAVGPDLPVVVDLGAVGVLGICGPRPPALGLTRALVGQLAVLRSPRELTLVLLAADGRAADWSWSRWLPHLRRGTRALAGLDRVQRPARTAELVSLLEERLAAARAGYRGAAAPDGRIVVLIDGAARIAELPGLSRLLRHGPEVGIHAICLDESPERLPAECGAVAMVTGEVGSRLEVAVAGRAPIRDVVLDAAGTRWAERVARALAPLRDLGETADAALPDRVRLLDLLGVEHPRAADVARDWLSAPDSARAVIGTAADGDLSVDLAIDGPHALVAGTTGAGKSELLQSLVASLALAHRPDQLGFVLVDYKGGAAFRECARLPHVAGLVTDLDGHLTERALRSLSAELGRRERLLDAAGAGDLAGYRAARGDRPDLPELGRLVIVVDEFAALADELPEFVSGLVGVAARGRSLGIHLLLATQRPGGVVSAEIRANTGLRIALRVTDPVESSDVLDAPVAATIPRGTPGRGYLRRTGEPPVAFQAGRVAGASPPRHRAAVVVPVPWTAAAEPALPDPAAEDSETDLAGVVRACRQAAATLGLSTVPSPWLAPLPDLIGLAELPAISQDGTEPAIPLGLLDDPDGPAQRTVAVDLAAGGSMLVAGGPRSGRTSLLRTVLAGIAERVSAADLHVHVLDFAGGELAVAGELPHTGTVVGRDELSRAGRLLDRLAEEIERRRAALAAAGVGSLAEARTARVALPATEHGSIGRTPWVVLLVDGFEAFRDASEHGDGGRAVDTLLRCVRDGAAAGIRVVMTSDRAGLVSRVSSAFPQRLVLPLADRADYAIAGIDTRALPARLPPGRAVLAGSGSACQLALPSTDPDAGAQLAAVRAAAARAPRVLLPPEYRPLRVVALPNRVALSGRLPVPRPDSPLWTILGRAGDSADWFGLDLATVAPGMLVAGPPRSGRTTALRLIATSLAGRPGVGVTVVAIGRSPLRDLLGHPGITVVTDPAGSVEPAARDPGRQTVSSVVLADDLDALTDTAIGTGLGELVRRPRPAGIVIGAVRSDELLASFRSPVAELRRLRTGLLLCPGPGDGEAFGLRLPRAAQAGIPGRGLAVLPSGVVPIQLAMPDAPPVAGPEQVGSVPA